MMGVGDRWNGNEEADTWHFKYLKFNVILVIVAWLLILLKKSGLGSWVHDH
jgi:hypothetical protein